MTPNHDEPMKFDIAPSDLSARVLAAALLTSTNSDDEDDSTTLQAKKKKKKKKKKAPPSLTITPSPPNNNNPAASILPSLIKQFSFDSNEDNYMSLKYLNTIRVDVNSVKGCTADPFHSSCKSTSLPTYLFSRQVLNGVYNKNETTTTTTTTTSVDDKNTFPTHTSSEVSTIDENSNSNDNIFRKNLKPITPLQTLLLSHLKQTKNSQTQTPTNANRSSSTLANLLSTYSNSNSNPDDEKKNDLKSLCTFIVSKTSPTQPPLSISRQTIENRINSIQCSNCKKHARNLLEIRYSPNYLDRLKNKQQIDYVRKNMGDCVKMFEGAPGFSSVTGVGDELWSCDVVCGFVTFQFKRPDEAGCFGGGGGDGKVKGKSSNNNDNVCKNNPPLILSAIQNTSEMTMTMASSSSSSNDTLIDNKMTEITNLFTSILLPSLPPSRLRSPSSSVTSSPTTLSPAPSPNRRQSQSQSQKEKQPPFAIQEIKRLYELATSHLAKLSATLPQSQETGNDIKFTIQATSYNKQLRLGVDNLVRAYEIIATTCRGFPPSPAPTPTCVTDCGGEFHTDTLGEDVKKLGDDAIACCIELLRLSNSANQDYLKFLKEHCNDKGEGLGLSGKLRRRFIELLEKKLNAVKCCLWLAEGMFSVTNNNAINNDEKVLGRRNMTAMLEAFRFEYTKADQPHLNNPSSSEAGVRDSISYIKKIDELRISALLDSRVNNASTAYLVQLDAETRLYRECKKASSLLTRKHEGFCAGLLDVSGGKNMILTPSYISSLIEWKENQIDPAATKLNFKINSIESELDKLLKKHELHVKSAKAVGGGIDGGTNNDVGKEEALRFASINTCVLNHSNLILQKCYTLIDLLSTHSFKEQSQAKKELELCGGFTGGNKRLDDIMRGCLWERFEGLCGEWDAERLGRELLEAEEDWMGAKSGAAAGGNGKNAGKKKKVKGKGGGGEKIEGVGFESDLSKVDEKEEKKKKVELKAKVDVKIEVEVKKIDVAKEEDPEKKKKEVKEISVAEDKKEADDNDADFREGVRLSMLSVGSSNGNDLKENDTAPVAKDVVVGKKKDDRKKSDKKREIKAEAEMLISSPPAKAEEAVLLDESLLIEQENIDFKEGLRLSSLQVQPEIEVQTKQQQQKDAAGVVVSKAKNTEPPAIVSASMSKKTKRVERSEVEKQAEDYLVEKYIAFAKASKKGVAETKIMFY